jgi:hypothetical protein
LFAALGALCYVRSTFQVAVLLLVLLVMLVMFREDRRAVVLGAVIPLVLVLGLSAKNWALFGTPTTSSWVGMNLMQVDQHAFRGDESTELQRKGVLSPVSLVGVFLPLDAYRGFVTPSRSYPNVDVLQETTKPSGSPNFNNLEYIAISRKDMHAFIRVLLHRPQIYLRGVWIGLKTAVWPSDNYYFFLQNRDRSKFQTYVHAYDTFLLGQVRLHWYGGDPFGTAWGIVIGYALALLVGATEFIRVSLGRCGSRLVAFSWVVIAYSTVVMTFGEVTENQRVRFPTDALVLAVVAYTFARASGPGCFAEAGSFRRRHAKTVSPRPGPWEDRSG